MEFIFEHNAGNLLPFLVKTGSHLQTVLPAGNSTDTLVHRCKFILTELCTNGIKHSGMPHSIFNIYVEANHLVIQKKEHGQPFCAVTKRNGRLIFPDDVTGIVTLTEDGMNRVNAQRMNEQTVNFYAEELSSKKGFSETKKINEHFGLIIICRSSNNFVYTRSPDGLNIFTAYITIA